MADAQLEIHVHVEDGRTSKFVQSDPQRAQELLQHIQPNRLFGQPVFTLYGDNAFMAFQSALVTHLTLTSDSLPDWPFYNNVVDVQAIEREKFQEAIKGSRREVGLIGMPTLTEPVTVYAAMELVNGTRLYLQVCVKPESRLPVEEGHFVQQLFTSSGLYARRPGGALIVNPACVVSFAFYPGPPAMPAGAWQADYVSG